MYMTCFKQFTGCMVILILEARFICESNSQRLFYLLNIISKINIVKPCFVACFKHQRMLSSWLRQSIV